MAESEGRGMSSTQRFRATNKSIPPMPQRGVAKSNITWSNDDPLQAIFGHYAIEISDGMLSAGMAFAHTMRGAIKKAARMVKAEQRRIDKQQMMQRRLDEAGNR